MPTYTTPLRECECVCGCDEPGTQTSESEVVCDECADYYCDEDGEVVCSRMQTAESQCRHCGTPIAWGPIMTGGIGGGNHRSGRCECRDWTDTERGSEWMLGERERDEE